jgi:hypothetical protein
MQRYDQHNSLPTTHTGDNRPECSCPQIDPWRSAKLEKGHELTRLRTSPAGSSISVRAVLRSLPLHLTDHSRAGLRPGRWDRMGACHSWWPAQRRASAPGSWRDRGWNGEASPAVIRPAAIDLLTCTTALSNLVDLG